MTDVMSEAFGRELNARTTFEKEAVWLPLLAVHALNGGETVVRGKTFTDCVIEGPAVIAMISDVVLDSCNMGTISKASNLMLKPMGDHIVGAIGFSDCRFVRCRFVQVGFTGADTFLEEIAAGISIRSDDKGTSK